MTPLRARFTLFAVMAIFLASAGNALFLQDPSRSLRMNGLPSTDVAVTQLPQEKTPVIPPAKAAIPSAPLPAVRPAVNDARDPRLYIALKRELGQRGYSEQLRVTGDGLRLAVLAYEFDNKMPLTGEPSEALLKQMLFNPNRAAPGMFADRAEADPQVVLKMQKVLLGLAFLRGAPSGRLDVWTASAIRDFERHRHLPVTGRLTEVTLLEIIKYSGQPLQLSSE